MKKIFYRTLLSVGVQNPEDRKEKLILGPLFQQKITLKFEKLFLKCLVLSVNGVHRDYKSSWNTFFSGKLVFLKNFFREQLFWTLELSVRVQMFDDRKEKLQFGEKNFLLDVFSPQKKLFVLVWFVNGAHRIDITNKNISLERLFFLGKGFSPKTFLIDIVINGGYKRPMIERKFFILENSSHRKHFM